MFALVWQEPLGSKLFWDCLSITFEFCLIPLAYYDVERLFIFGHFVESLRRKDDVRVMIARVDLGCASNLMWALISLTAPKGESSSISIRPITLMHLIK